MTGWTARDRTFDGIDDDGRAALDAIAPMTVPKGAVLFNPGDAVKGFVVVLRGQVSVFLTGPTGRDILLYQVAPGQSCIQSTLGLLGGDDYTAEAVTDEECEVVLIPRSVFLGLLDRSSMFRTFVFHAFAARMQAMMQILETVTFKRVESRLATALLARADADDLVQATHQDLASIIGSAREVVSRRLESFSDAGLVQPERGRVRLLDRAGLQRIAEGPASI